MTPWILLPIAIWYCGMLIGFVLMSHLDREGRCPIGTQLARLLLWPLFLLSLAAYIVVCLALLMAHIAIGATRIIWLAIKWPWIWKENQG